MRVLVPVLCLGLMLAGSAASQDASNQLLQLHDALRLSADQEDGWKTYEAAVTPNAQAIARHRATALLLPQLPTPRRIALIEATMAADEADFHRQDAAVITFYTHLTADQQRSFDMETRPTAPEPGAAPPVGLRPGPNR